MLKMIVLFLLICGPLRPWVGRHWALLVSTIAGGLLGLIAASWVMQATGHILPGLALICATLGAIVCGKEGPVVLRNLQNDGKRPRR